MPAADSNVWGQNSRHPVFNRKLTLLFSMLRPEIALQRCANIKHKPLIVKQAKLFGKVAQLFTLLHPLIVKHKPLIVKLAQLFSKVA
ncbi:hypothetical protein IQ273_14625 [Nodosilinea sp. LEGE 07298]|uniref:hypothetical protein n=1 Tax=Nodosilinea sp. LEGE 07298 TaxID=2777970 RepID=UPI001880D939|nr:hypothetical protein [Nodosilinea sp. LEGE 07298]MBE9110653.1 hypothetical protein [Nodosilinea sp. LEGE 07298]